MKVTRKNKVKLEDGEIRIGNFFIREEPKTEHIKITDLNGVFSFRVWTRIPVGIWLKNMLEQRADDTLKTYIAVMWSVFSVAPDDEYVAGLLNLANEALNRHPDWYGFDPSATDEDDEKAATEVREMMEFEQEVRNLAEKEK